MSYFLRWLQAFLFTQIIEVPIYRRPLGGRTWVAFGASALTHPLVWFVLPHVLPGSYAEKVCLEEAFAVCVEAGYVALFRLRSPWFWSLIANGASFGLGLLSRHFFGRP